MKEITLLIPDMMCAHCEKRVRDSIEAEGGTVKSIDIDNKLVILESLIPEEKLLEILGEAGYRAEVIL